MEVKYGSVSTICRTKDNHQTSVAACLVQGVYIQERDRQQNRRDSNALAPPWWEFFHFQLLSQLKDDADSSIFGAIYELTPPASSSKLMANGTPRYVIAFRGTLTKPGSVSRDLELDLQLIQNGLHSTSRFEIGMQAVRNMVAAASESNVWLAGHSLGAAMAMLAGKTMAKSGKFLQAYLFNPPFFSAPIERIADQRVKHGLRFAGSVITAGLALASKKHTIVKSMIQDPFDALAAWVPSLYVNPADHICSEYIGYFEHRNRMKEIGAGSIEKLATQHSLGGLFMNVIGGKESSDPLHLIPSANLITNSATSRDFLDAHGIHQWWQPDLNLQCKVHKY